MEIHTPIRKKMYLLSFFFYRKYIISRKQAEVPLSVPFDPRNQVGRPLVVEVAPVAEFRLTWFHLVESILVFIINTVHILCRCIWATTMFLLWRCWPLKTTGASPPRRTRSFFFLFPDSTGGGFTGSGCCSVLKVLRVWLSLGSTLHPGTQVNAEFQGGSWGGCSCWTSFPAAGWAQQQAQMGHALPVTLSQSHLLLSKRIP